MNRKLSLLAGALLDIFVIIFLSTMSAACIIALIAVAAVVVRLVVKICGYGN